MTNLRRFGAHTIARFLPVMQVFLPNDAIRFKCFIRNAHVLKTDVSQVKLRVKHLNITQINILITINLYRY
jgi:hypothetical protein